jgi:rhamnopyranosyl-N-acetylglucosaminyl-diphospho-decaprenol beta-1,3/1,4-galactofuranosyltransferase
VSGPPAVAKQRVVAVIVTYRRVDLLRACVDSVIGQTRPPDEILVIDNGGIAAEVLAGRPEVGGLVSIVEPGENLGPAGGYALGFERALTLGATKIWTVDDDCEPAPDCLSLLLAAESGRDVVVPLQLKPAGPRGYPPSWNGPLFDAEAVRRIGSPRADLFFWAEDTEFVTRLRAAGVQRIHVPEAIVVHRNPAARRRGDRRDWQLYYEIRNTLEYRLRVRRTAKGIARALVAIGGTALSILAFEPAKAESLSLWWRGISDFRKRRFGRRVDPARWADAR